MPESDESESDVNLARLFAETRHAPSAEEFVATVAQRIARERRRWAVRKLFIAVVLAGAALAATPYVTEGSLAIGDRLAGGLPAVSAAAASSPIAWACAVAIAVWALRRPRAAKGR